MNVGRGGMIFNVSQLLKESTGFARAFTLDETLPFQEFGNDSRIVGDVRMLRTEKGIWVEAKLSSHVRCSCSRCLLDFVQPVELDVQEEFLPRVDVSTGSRLVGTSDFTEDFHISQNHILDLAEAAKQYIEMNTPMKPVCNDRCKGICLRCGVDLNEKECRCLGAEIDPRWAALLDLAESGTLDAN